ncbi:MAG: cyclophilin-like superfamily protein [Actinobacteria bacterium 13_1_20CM_4_69_9]|jgi:hypothetical protein|nr:MAG: cyclophilin-like superfamily protein [Actinobacteria bacterium 13_1_20CM_4_69_9]
MLRITSGGFSFAARVEDDTAPQTVAAFLKLLPLDSKIIQARWSGQSAWIPMGDLDVGIGPENATSYPAAGELLLYPGGVSETELLFPYGHTCFASKAGQLAGNHFATIVEGGERLQELGELVLWHGAQDISFREA